MDKLLFLGTGAADWFMDERKPGDFFRRNCAALVNDDLMIDCGEHIFDFAECAGRKDLYDNVTDIIITHHHSDHFNPHSVRALADNHKIRLACDSAARKMVGAHPNIQFVNLTPFKAKKMGRYRIIPVLANHDVVINRSTRAYHYIIETPDHKKIFYGLDGAWLLRPTWAEMLQHKYDVMVFDCTVGDSDDWRLYEHNTIPMLRTMTKEIKEKQLLTENGMLVASHLARTLHVSHEKTVEILKKLDMLTAYDGMEININ